MVGPTEEVELEQSSSLSIALQFKLFDAILVLGVDAIHESDAETIAIDTRLGSGPILVSFRTAAFDQTRQHHDHVHLLLPDHTPEVDIRRGQRSLSRNVKRITGTTNEASVDVIRLGIARNLKLHTRGVH